MKRLARVLRFARTNNFVNWQKGATKFESDLVPVEPPARKKSKRTRRARKHK